MKFIDNKTVVIEGNLYTDMYFDPELLDSNGITIHVKRDVFLGIMEKPNRLKSGDIYMRYEEFINTYGPIYDILAFSKI